MESQRRAAALILAMASALLLVLMLGACSVNPAGPAGDVQSLVEECPDGTVGVYTGSDISGSQSGQRVTDELRSVVRDQAMYAGACSARMRVSAFAVSPADTAVLLDKDMSVTGATDIAKARQVVKGAEAATKQVEEKYAEAVATLPRDSSAILGQLALAAEFRAQLASAGKPVHLELVLVTDGIDSSIPELSDPNLTVERAAELAAGVTVPDLTDANVVVTGIGRVDGRRIGSGQSEAVKRFWTDVFAKAGAASASVVTDYQPRIG